MEPNDEMTRALAVVRALLQRCTREAAFELARWALQLRNER